MTQRGDDFVTAPAYGMPPPPKPRSFGRRWARWMVATVAVAIVGAVWAVRPLVSWAVKGWATTQGIDLSFGDLTLATGELTLTDVRLTTRSFEGLLVSAPRATFHVKHLVPERMELTSPRVSFTGTPAQAVDRLLAWTREQQGKWPAVAASDVAVTARAGTTEAPWLQVQPISLTSMPSGATMIGVREIALQGRKVGPLLLTWQRTAAGGTLFSGDSPATSPVTLSLPEGKLRPTVRIEAHKVGLRMLGAWMTVPASMAPVEVDGQSEITLLDDQSVDGSLALTLLHYTPPHPPEVSSLVASDRTTLQAGFHLPGRQRTATVSPLTVTSGRLTLKGTGTTAIASDHVALSATLNGSLPCKDVVRSAAATNLGGMFGGLVGQMAEVALQGNLLLTVRVEADSRQPGQASFSPAITARCGIGL